MNTKLNGHKQKFIFRVGIIALKLLALALVFQSVFVNFANKVATVLVTGDSPLLPGLRHKPIVSYYSYISHNRYLNLWDLRLALIVLGIAIYAEALLLELLTKQKGIAADGQAPAIAGTVAAREPDARPG